MNLTDLTKEQRDYLRTTLEKEANAQVASKLLKGVMGKAKGLTGRVKGHAKNVDWDQFKKNYVSEPGEGVRRGLTEGVDATTRRINRFLNRDEIASLQSQLSGLKGSVGKEVDHASVGVIGKNYQGARNTARGKRLSLGVAEKELANKKRMLNNASKSKLHRRESQYAKAKETHLSAQKGYSKAQATEAKQYQDWRNLITRNSERLHATQADARLKALLNNTESHRGKAKLGLGVAGVGGAGLASSVALPKLNPGRTNEVNIPSVSDDVPTGPGMADRVNSIISALGVPADKVDLARNILTYGGGSLLGLMLLRSIL